MRYRIYFLPTMLTLTNAGLGFFAITCIMVKRYITAAWIILVSILMDLFDGIAARLIKATSKFGTEIDSLADVISFGVAPALLSYNLWLRAHKKAGFILILFYIFTSILRLARYNIITSGEKPDTINYSIGLPIPYAAGLIASLVLFETTFFNHIAPIVIFVLSLLMILPLRYISPKYFKFEAPVALKYALVFVAVVLLVYVYPKYMILILFVAYIISGIMGYIFQQIISRNKPRSSN